ncbi:hypothetical protein AVEN_4481-1 [Araneus ventricosus]|uniref:Uncharacterized protein n=1 Tax=Araneus ventricosus TaxID=182803 RepID=A0A4Y2QMF8_ARAVE|nr:hypothetical protein AVEN_522-1 [Araneus ventricosus]GBN64503.1 hypothetical protein AVEN_4481-1 [Araneus ventricosus]
MEIITLFQYILSQYNVFRESKNNLKSQKRTISALPWHPGSIEERSPRQIGLEVGILIATTGHGSAPPEGDTHRHRWRATQSPPLLYPKEKREPVYFSGGFSSTLPSLLSPSGDRK